MKSKKIVALIVAFAAFMAVATSGLAATTTTTTYDATTGKVSVDVTAIAGADSEVTYLVKNKAGSIVYIDQDTAKGGTATFNYKIDKKNLVDADGKLNLETSVAFGTNGSIPVDETDKDIELELASITAANATVTYWADNGCTVPVKDGDAIVAEGSTIYAKIVANKDFEITSCAGYTGNLPASTVTVSVTKGANITVTTAAVEKTPVVLDFAEVLGSGSVTGEDGKSAVEAGLPESDLESGEIENETYTAVTKIIKVVGTPEIVGVEYNDEIYPALAADGSQNYTEDALYAVRIIVKGNDITRDVVKPYVK